MSMDVQRQIRENTLELNEFLKDLKGWEQTVKEKERKIQGKGAAKDNKNQKSSTPLRQAPNSSEPKGKVAHETKTKKAEGKKNPDKDSRDQPELRKQGIAPGKSVTTAAGHTYEHFLEKWDKFDVDAALKEVDEEGEDDRPVKKVPKREFLRPRAPQKTIAIDKWGGLPGDVDSVDHSLPQGKMLGQGVDRLAPVGGRPGPFGFDDAPPDAASEKDIGNEYFREGKYVRAIECYSRSIALQPTAVAYANRAMCAIKIRRFDDAELDCSEAILLDDRYTKAYARRGTARRELKKYLGAVEDFEFALRLEPANKELKMQYTDVEELYQKAKGLKLPQQGIPGALKKQKEKTTPHLLPTKQAPVAGENDARITLLPSEVSTDAVSTDPQRVPPIVKDMKDLKEKNTLPHVQPAPRQPIVAFGDDAHSTSLPSEIPMDATTKSCPKESSSDAGSLSSKSTPKELLTDTGSLPRTRNSAPNFGISTKQDRVRDKSQAKVVAATQAAAARAAASHSMTAVSRNIAAPKSSYEFELMWKGFAGNRSLQTQLLKVMDPLSLPKVFKDSLSAPLLLEIIQSLEGLFPEAAELAVQILENLTRVGRFNMTVMFLTSKDKTGLKQLWEGAFMNSPDELHTQLQTLRSAYRLV